MNLSGLGVASPFNKRDGSINGDRPIPTSLSAKIPISPTPVVSQAPSYQPRLSDFIVFVPSSSTCVRSERKAQQSAGLPIYPNSGSYANVWPSASANFPTGVYPVPPPFRTSSSNASVAPRGQDLLHSQDGLKSDDSPLRGHQRQSSNHTHTNIDASSFIPKKKIVIKTQDGKEVDLEEWRKKRPARPAAPTNPLVSKTSVTLETVEAKKERIAGLNEKAAKLMREQVLNEQEKIQKEGIIVFVNPPALASARMIEDLGSVPYPDWIMRPNIGSTMKDKHRGFRYNREFLLQFMSFCKAKPYTLLPLEIIEKSNNKSLLAVWPNGLKNCDVLPLFRMSEATRLCVSGFKLSTWTRMLGVTTIPADDSATDERVSVAPMFRSLSFPPPVSSDIYESGSTTRPQAILDGIEIIKIKESLSILTTDNVSSTANQIYDLVTPEKPDGILFSKIIELVLEKATDSNEPASVELSAQFCRQMMDRISLDDPEKHIGNTSVSGRRLFQRCLWDYCQDGFERGSQTLSQFRGELFKLQMMTEGEIYEYVKKILGHSSIPGKQDIECLHRLLMVAGKTLDSAKGHNNIMMDVYFSRMKVLADCEQVSPAARHLLQDLIQCRAQKWILVADMP